MSAKKAPRSSAGKDQQQSPVGDLQHEVASMVASFVSSDSQREVWGKFLNAVDGSTLQHIKKFFTQKPIQVKDGKDVTLDEYLAWYRGIRDDRKKLLSGIANANPALKKDSETLFHIVPGERMDSSEAERLLATDEGIVEYLSTLTVGQMEAFIEWVKGEGGKRYSEDERKALIALFERLQPLAFDHERELSGKVFPLARGIANVIALQSRIAELKAIHDQLTSSSDA